MLCFCNQKLADISSCYLPVQLNRPDILYSVVSTVELTLTLLEVPSITVVALVSESEGSRTVARGLLQRCHASCAVTLIVNQRTFDCCLFFVV